MRETACTVLAGSVTSQTRDQQLNPDELTGSPTKRRQEAAEHAAEAKRRAVAAASVREEASASASRANDAWASGAQACSSADIPADPESVETAIGICGDLPDLIAQAAAAGQSAITAQSAALASALRAAVQAQRQAEAETAAAQARHGAEESAAERKQLPNLEAARQARHQAEETARNAHAAAEAAAAAAAEVERQDTAVRKAFTDLNKAARTPDGRMVPTDPATVSEQREHLTELRDTAEDWSRAASRAHLLLVTAARQREAADEAERGAKRGRAQARKLGGEAQTARHRYTEELRQHGRDYQDLVAELEDRQGEYKQISGFLKAEEDKGSSAEKELAAIGARLSGLEEHCQIAANNCDRSLSRLQLLFDHGLIQGVVGAETLTRPAILDEAADTARRLLEGRSLQRDNLVASAEASARQALNRLDTRIRSVRDRLLRLGRHIHLEDVAETGWRRVAVAEQSQESADTPVSATTTKPLRAALETLTLSIQKLESDFNERVRTEVKGTLLSDLRKQINIRIELASQIVADITDTLKKVRTGVARVGVKLAWLPREDPLAAQAISLIRDPRLEEELDGMYDFFIKQLVAEGSEDTSWAERVRQVFDYRNWYQWEIHLTHADFTEPGSGESFRKVTPRNNPLETLSTGEKRLAVMLPLLAAARAFYSVEGYEGPRTIFIDELNAAFDPQNLRMTLALLREWNFDLIATLPTMDPLLVAETGSVAVHRIGKQREEFRYAIPCVWDGNGQPVTVQIAVGSMASKRRHSGRAADPATAAPATGEALFDLTSGTA